MKRIIINESFSDKVELAKRFLDSNFMRASEQRNGDDGLKKAVAVFIQLDTNHLPSKTSMYKQDVLDIMNNQDTFMKMYPDEKERNEFLDQAIKAWYDNRISKYGSLLN